MSSTSRRAHSPPPPPQRRRSSLTMSGTTLDTLLRQAPVPRGVGSSVGGGGSSSGGHQHHHPSIGMQLRARSRPTTAPEISRTAAGASQSSVAASTAATRSHHHHLRMGMHLRAATATAASPDVDQSWSALAARRRSDLTRRVMESLAASRAATVPASVASLPPAPPPPPPPVASLNTARRSSPRLSRKKPPPSEQKRPAKRQKTTGEPLEPCCICMCTPPAQDAATLDCNCQNSFCFGCIQEWSKTENSCPLCKARFTTIESESATARVKTANQRSEAGAALEGLLASLSASSHHHRLGRFLLRSMSEEDPFMPGFMNVILRSTVTTHLQLAHSSQAGNLGRSAETAIDLADSESDEES